MTIVITTCASSVAGGAMREPTLLRTVPAVTAHDLAGLGRVLVLGSPGAGKSTLAWRLANDLGLPLVRLDDLYWRAGWRRFDTGDFARSVRHVLAWDRWLIEGHYGDHLLGERVAAADAVVYVDTPAHTCLRRIVVRAVRRACGDTASLPSAMGAEHARASLRPNWRFAWKILRFPRRERLRALAIMERAADTCRCLVLRASREDRHP